ncbi:hypothetical protein [Arthrobacter sp.]|uniref:hypothetical protein n=1 Tax=Arthrobacter sp. TaxID=1667 RepID=UPI003A920B09
MDWTVDDEQELVKPMQGGPHDGVGQPVSGVTGEPRRLRLDRLTWWVAVVIGVLVALAGHQGLGLGIMIGGAVLGGVLELVLWNRRRPRP